MNKLILLEKTLLRASSGINTIRHSKDKKRRSRAIAEYFGYGILLAFLAIYCFFEAYALASFGMVDMVPSGCGVIVVMIGFVFTFIKSNGYMFGFRDYDTLMAMPFSVTEVILGKFIYMYVHTLPWVLTVAYSMLIGTMVGAKLGVLSIVMWVVLSPVLPIIPMTLASLLAALTARVSIGFKNKKIAQIILTFLLVIPIFGLQFVLQNMLENEAMEEVLSKIGGIGNSVAGVFVNIRWFESCILKSNILWGLLLTAVSVVLMVLFAIILSKSYRRINSSAMVGAAHKKYSMTDQRRNSMERTIAVKEFKRFINSIIYATNAGMGEIMAFILSIILLFVKPETILAKIIVNPDMGAPVSVDMGMLVVLAPLVVYLLVGMEATTAISPSLEGKNYWIMQSLPITKLTDCRGKILFNLWLTIPFETIGVLAVSYATHAPLVCVVLSLLAGWSLCLMSSLYGMVIGIKFRKLEWENEVQVVKQGAAVLVYMFPNMIFAILMCVGTVKLWKTVPAYAELLAIMVVALAVSTICYGGVKALCGKE